MSLVDFVILTFARAPNRERDANVKINPLGNKCPTPEALMEFAFQETGLDDFGDHQRNAGLGAFVASLREEVWPAMTDRAREIVVDYLVHHLGTRLWLID